jgi:hypothetical protein
MAQRGMAAAYGVNKTHLEEPAEKAPARLPELGNARKSMNGINSKSSNNPNIVSPQLRSGTKSVKANDNNKTTTTTADDSAESGRVNGFGQ